MPSNIGRTLHLCFSKLNRSKPNNNNNNNHNNNINQSPSPPPPSSSSSSTTTTIKDHNNSSNLVVTKNFNSLYDFTTATTTTTNITITSPSPTTSNSLSRSTTDFFSTSSSSDNFSDATDPTTTASPPDIAAVFSSQRFFFSFPGRSNSIFDSINHDVYSSCSRYPSSHQLLVAGGVPFQTYSPDPFLDFRQSMQEMVEARDLLDVRANWEGLYELLSCYLDLNPKHIHKFIIGAFADLLLSLVATSSATKTKTTTVTVAGGCPESDVVSMSTTSGSRCKISLQLV